MTDTVMASNPQNIVREVVVSHRLMVQTLQPKLMKQMTDNLSRDVFASQARFDEIVASTTKTLGQIQVLQVLLVNIRDFLSWKQGTRKNRSKTVGMTEAQALFARLRAFLFGSVAVAYAIPNVMTVDAIRVRLPDRLMESLFSIYENKELIYHHETLRLKLTPSNEKPSEVAYLLFNPTTISQRKEAWPEKVSQKMNAAGMVYTAFENHSLASAYYGSASKSKTLLLGNEDEKTRGSLIEEFMQLMWSCCNAEQNLKGIDLAYRFYFLVSQTWMKIGEQQKHNPFYIPGDYKYFVQAPHLDYSPTRNNRIRKKDHQDIWSMDLPLTKEGCTIMIWPGPGTGMACHIKYNEVLLRSPSLVHSGGIPGKENGDAFRLHAALGSTKYLAEIDGQARTFKEDAKRVSFQKNYHYPTPEDVMRAVNDRYP